MLNRGFNRSGAEKEPKITYGILNKHNKQNSWCMLLTGGVHTLKKLRVKFHQENVVWGATQTGLNLPRSW